MQPKFMFVSSSKDFGNARIVTGQWESDADTGTSPSLLRECCCSTGPISLLSLLQKGPSAPTYFLYLWNGVFDAPIWALFVEGLRPLHLN